MDKKQFVNKLCDMSVRQIRDYWLKMIERAEELRGPEEEEAIKHIRFADDLAYFLHGLTWIQVRDE